MISININNKNWWNKTKEITEINGYLTYQKTLCDELEINQIMAECMNELPEELRNKYKINIYYRYQPPIKHYL